MPIQKAMILKEAGCVLVNLQLDSFQSELAVAT